MINYSWRGLILPASPSKWKNGMNWNPIYKLDAYVYLVYVHQKGFTGISPLIRESLRREFLALFPLIDKIFRLQDFQEGRGVNTIHAEKGMKKILTSHIVYLFLFINLSSFVNRILACCPHSLESTASGWYHPAGGDWHERYLNKFRDYEGCFLPGECILSNPYTVCI